MLSQKSNNALYILGGALAGDKCSSYYQGDDDPGDLITPDRTNNDIVEKCVQNRLLPLESTKSWTTFGFYVQTDTLKKRALELGAQCVDGESASLFAVANRYNVPISIVLYWTDAVLSEMEYQFRDVAKGHPEFATIKNVALALSEDFSK